MTPRSPLILVSFALLLCSVLITSSKAQGPSYPGRQDEKDLIGQDAEEQFATRGGPPPPGLDQEKMWPAPTAEDWKKPVPITFQRTWEDALEVARQTERPILICVNMDGEPASEHYAGIRYRQPDIAKLYEPYVTVIASVYRHNPRDYDEAGRRILCPRFGSVTCGEHITIEPLLYEKFFNGFRVSPRHIMVELDQSETYDVFYTWDTQSVFDTVEKAMEGRGTGPATLVRGDRPILERVGSQDIRDRVAVEKAYAEGDANLRKQLIEAAVENVESAPTDLLRMAIFGLDTDLAKRAREALAGSTSVNSTDLIAEALRAQIPQDEREALIGALTEIGKKSKKAKTLSVVQRGLSTKSGSVDVRGWTSSMGGAEAGIVNNYEMASRIAQQQAALESEDPAARIDLAEAFLARAFAERFPAGGELGDEDKARLYFLDARDAAEQAIGLKGNDWRSHAVVALATYYIGETEKALSQIEEAVEMVPDGDSSYNAMALLELFAKLRMEQIADAWEAKEEWPPEWLTDINAACSVLARHPLGTDDQISWHYDILKWLDARGAAERVLAGGLKRFPESPSLHDRFRQAIIKQRGMKGLESRYEEMLAQEGASSTLEWYAGFASRMSAEFYRRRGRDDAALESYTNALNHYERYGSKHPESKEAGDAEVALVLAGQARIAFEKQEFGLAVDRLLASFDRYANAAATPDGLNLTPMDTARALRSRLEEENSELFQRLEEALDKLDPELLKPPAYELPIRRRR